jgi:hypothetical protein
MASAGNINYEFTASVSDLEAKAVIAQKIIEEKIGTQIDGIGTKSTVSDKKIVGMMKNIAREGRAVSPMLGKIGVAIAEIDAVVVPLYRSFETFFAKLQPRLEAFGSALLSKIVSPVGIAVVSIGALVAAGVALVQMFGKAEQSARAYAAAVQASAKAEVQLAEAMATAELKAALRHDPSIKWKTQAEEAQKYIDETSSALLKLTNSTPDRITAIIEGRSEFEQPEPGFGGTGSVDPFNPFAKPEDSGGLATKLRDTMVEKLRAQNAALVEATRQLRQIEERESALKQMEEDWGDSLKAIEDQRVESAREAEKAAEKQGAAAEKAADREYAAQARLEEQAQAKANADAERAAAEQQQHEDRLNLIKLAEAQVQQSQYAFYEWAASLEANMADVYAGIQSLAQMATQGIGDAFARAAVYGESFGAAMDALWKQMAASLISMVIQVALQELVYLAMSSLMVVAAATTKIAAEMTYGVIAAAASAYASLPFPANMFAAPAAGAAALATMTALAGTAKAAGIGIGAGLAVPGAAHGALVTGDMLMRVGEGGQKELIAPRSDYERLFNARQDSGGIAVYLDGRELTHSVARYIPQELRKHGVR